MDGLTPPSPQAVRHHHTAHTSTTHTTTSLHLLLHGDLRLILKAGILTTHLHAETRLIPQEELVEVRPSLRTTSNASEAPSVQLASERGELGLLEVPWQDLSRELLLLVDDKALAVWDPGNDVGMLLAGENVHQLHVTRSEHHGENIIYFHDVSLLRLTCDIAQDRKIEFGQQHAQCTPSAVRT